MQSDTHDMTLKEGDSHRPHIHVQPKQWPSGSSDLSVSLRGSGGLAEAGHHGRCIQHRRRLHDAVVRSVCPGVAHGAVTGLPGPSIGGERPTPFLGCHLPPTHGSDSPRCMHPAQVAELLEDAEVPADEAEQERAIR